jgi:hypothetical protein
MPLCDAAETVKALQILTNKFVNTQLFLRCLACRVATP